jgi:cell division protein ZapA
MDKQLPIKLKILERAYPLRIPWEQEEGYRKAAKQVNDLAKAYRQQFPELDLQDILSMACIQIAVRMVQAEEALNTAPFEERIEQLCQQIDDILDV